MTQTPQQRKANERYAKLESAKRGKPESAIKQKQKFKQPISPLWIGMSTSSPAPTKSYSEVGLLVFVLCGGLIFELIRVFF
ncbi:hypothetical protein MMC26_007715 [Xylographa opegraphella]|nr:hypothetical protein [Xylographa opegraphella]